MKAKSLLGYLVFIAVWVGLILAGYRLLRLIPTPYP